MGVVQNIITDTSNNCPSDFAQPARSRYYDIGGEFLGNLTDTLPGCGGVNTLHGSIQL